MARMGTDGCSPTAPDFTGPPGRHQPALDLSDARGVAVGSPRPATKHVLLDQTMQSTKGRVLVYLECGSRGEKYPRTSNTNLISARRAARMVADLSEREFGRV